LKDFLFIFNKFLSSVHKKNTSSNTPLLLFYSVIPLTDKINSLIFQDLIFTVEISV